MDFDENRKEQEVNRYQPDPTRRELIRAEQPKDDAIEILYNPKEPDPKGKNQAIMDQYDQANEPSSETVRLRNFKRRQMNEFTDNYLFSQVMPSRAVTVINVINTFLLTVVLIIAFVVAFGLLVGLRIGLVPTDSMKDKISVGSLVVIQPVKSIEDIRKDDILSYSYGSQDYIHLVASVVPSEGGTIVMVGANKDDPKYETLKHTIDFQSVHGRMVLSIPYLGYVIMFVKQYFIVVLAVFICLLLGLLLSRALLEKKNNDEDFKEFLERKTEYEREAVRKEREARKKDDEIRFNNLMHE